MVFGLSGAALAAGTVAVAGLGVSAASAAGAFNKKVDSSGPTPQEIEATRQAQRVYEQGKRWQSQLDPLYLQRLDQNLEQLYGHAGQLGVLRKDLNKMNKGSQYAAAGDRAVNEVWANTPPMQDQLQTASAGSGGPGSGRAMSAVISGATGLDRAIRSGNTSGRLGHLGEYTQRRGQFGGALQNYGQRLNSVASETQGLFGDYSQRIQTGLGLMTGSGQSAQQAQQNRISMQVQDNIARNQAMGAVGGAMMSVGMAGMSAGGGGTAGKGSGAGGFSGTYGPGR